MFDFIFKLNRIQFFGIEYVNLVRFIFVEMEFIGKNLVD